MYRQLGIYVVLVGVEVWSEANPINMSTSASADDTMNAFLEYRRLSINPRHHNDNAQLIMYLRLVGLVLYVNRNNNSSTFADMAEHNLFRRYGTILVTFLLLI